MPVWRKDCPCGAVHPWNVCRTVLVRWPWWWWWWSQWWCCSISTKLHGQTNIRLNSYWFTEQGRPRFTFRASTHALQIISDVSVYSTQPRFFSFLFYPSVQVMWCTWAPLVASSGFLSSLIRRKRGNLREMPFSGSTWGQTQSQSVNSRQPLMHVRICPFVLVLYWPIRILFCSTL